MHNPYNLPLFNDIGGRDRTGVVGRGRLGGEKREEEEEGEEGEEEGGRRLG